MSRVDRPLQEYIKKLEGERIKFDSTQRNIEIFKKIKWRNDQKTKWKTGKIVEEHRTFIIQASEVQLTLKASELALQKSSQKIGALANKEIMARVSWIC